MPNGISSRPPSDNAGGRASGTSNTREFKIMTEPNEAPGIYFEGFYGKRARPYPGWRYHELYEPKLVKNTEEDIQASCAGWKEPGMLMTAVPHMANWNHDLEDMDARQLVLFAKEEYDVDLPEKAGIEKLIKAMWRLAQVAPQNEGRMVLLAQSIEMNYSETVDEIKRMAGDDADLDYTETKELWL